MGEQMMKESTKNKLWEVTEHSYKVLRIFLGVTVICYLIAIASMSVQGAETYFEETTNFFTNIDNLTGTCGEYVDWDGDGNMDLVGFKNATESDIIWQIFLNDGTSNQPSFPDHAIYNFTYTEHMSGMDNGGECVATVDINNDGLIDVLSYKAVVPDSSAALGNGIASNVVNKTGYRGFYITSGTATSPTLTWTNSHFEYSVLADSQIQNPLGSVNEYHYPVGTLLGSPWIYDDLANGCAADYLTTACYGENTYATQPRVYYQFFDADFDGDSDLFLSGANMEYFWYENIGDASSATWFATDDFISTRNCTGYDFHEIADFDSDGDIDYISGERAGVPSTMQLGMCNARGWVDDVLKDELGYISRNTTTPWEDAGEEPAQAGQWFVPLAVGDFDGDSYFDLVTYSNPSGANQYNFYNSTGLIGYAGGYSTTTPTCDFPCIYSDDFEGYANNTDLNDVAGWTAADCVDIVDGDVVLKGSCTTSRICYTPSAPVEVAATLEFNITANTTDSIRHSTHQSSYLGTHYIHNWVGNVMYQYRGTGLGMENLTAYNTTVKYEYANYMDFTNDNYTVAFGTYDGWRDMFVYYGTHQELQSFCFQAAYPASVALISDVRLYAGSNFDLDTTGTYQTPTTLECYGAFCWSADSNFEDASPDDYVPQATSFGGIVVDYERCVEEGFRPNLMCIPKLQWLDFRVSLNAWFVGNIVYLFIILLLLLTAAVFITRRRRSD